MLIIGPDPFISQSSPDHSPQPRINFSYYEISGPDICSLICDLKGIMREGEKGEKGNEKKEERKWWKDKRGDKKGKNCGRRGERENNLMNRKG